MSEEMFNKIAVIGAGNMGSAIAGGLLKFSDSKITVANRSEARLKTAVEKISAVAPDKKDNITATTDLTHAAEGAQLVVIAVKPWAVESVVEKIKSCLAQDAVVVSVAAGISIADLRNMLGGVKGGIVYMIPNTALQVGKGMTFAACEALDNSRLEAITALFAPMTKLKYIEESKMGAATALCSCGIAYVYKFIAAAAQAGVELGFSYDDAVDCFNATVAGAAAMIDSSDLTVQEQINAVTTPGGMTIRGINALERNGFTAAVIDSIIAPVKK